MKMTILNPQWQGGMDVSPYDGALEIERLYLKGHPYVISPVSLKP